MGDVSDDESEEEPEWKTDALMNQKKSQAKYPPLNRPIIMVCNDGWAKALYPLKDLALKLRVNAPAAERVNERLVQILRLEGIRSFSNAVRQSIVEGSQGDARSAITRCQMISSNHRLLDSSDHSKAYIAQ